MWNKTIKTGKVGNMGSADDGRVIEKKDVELLLCIFMECNIKRIKKFVIYLNSNIETDQKQRFRRMY